MTLFESQPVCPDCKGTNRVWNQKLDGFAPCPNRKYHRPDPARNEVIVAANAQQTSIDAAAAALPRSGTMRAQILSFICGKGSTGATDEEIESALNLRHQSASARRNELARDGWIEDSGARRNTSSGQKAIVWIWHGETTL